MVFLVVLLAGACQSESENPVAANGPSGLAPASAAIVIHPGEATCVMPGVGETGDLFGAPSGLSDLQRTENMSWIKLSCLNGQTTNLSGRAQVYAGFECNAAWPDGVQHTTDTRYTVSASGKASMTCRFRK
jgi:hypothetical protein